MPVKFQTLISAFLWARSRSVSWVNGRTMIEVSHARHDTLALLPGKPGKKRMVSLPVVYLPIFGCL
jgi:hypothetical protein